MPHSPRRGVTLLELLVVLLLLGVTAALVVPALLPRRPDPQSDAVDRAVTRARRYAIQRAESLRLQVRSDGAWVIQGSRSGTPVDSGGPTALGAVTSPLIVVIDPLGSCTPTNGPGAPETSATVSRGRFDMMSCRWESQAVSP